MQLNQTSFKDYNKFSHNYKTIITIALKFLVLDFLFSYFFYSSLYVFIISFVLFPIYFRVATTEYIRNQKEMLLNQFSDTLVSISINLKAGYALENAVAESYKDICLLYGQSSFMASEIIGIRKGLSINLTLEDMIISLAQRSHLEDIIVLSEVLGVAKRNGGNVTEVLYTTSEIVRQNINLNKEIKTTMASRSYELRIMESIPFLIILYVQMTSRNYFDVLYHNMRGWMLMTVCVVVYIVAVLSAKRIMQIEA